MAWIVFPESVKNSEILSGNNLGRLGNLEKLPTEEEMEKVNSLPEVLELYGNFCEDGKELSVKIHQLAKSWLESGKTMDALALLVHLER